MAKETMQAALKIVGTKRITLWIALIVLATWNIEKAPHAIGTRLPLYDFIQYWSASKAFVQGDNPFNPSTMLDIQKMAGWSAAKPEMMWNPPWVLPLLTPLSFFSFWTSRTLWFFLNSILTILAADWFWRIYGGKTNHRWVSWIAVILFLPFLQSMILGQISPLVLTGIWGFLWALRKDRQFLSGNFAILISIKPHLLYLFWIFLALWILKHHKWRILYGVAVPLAVLLIIVYAINSNSLIDYFHIIRSSDGPQIWQTPTWGIALHKYLPLNLYWARFISSIFGILTAVVLWFRWREVFRWEDRTPEIILLSLVTSVYTWSSDWILLLPISICIIVWSQHLPRRHSWIVMALILMQPLLALTLSRTQSNFFTIWFPPVLWCLYLMARVLNSKQSCYPQYR